jgi:hypothetical protein
MMNLQDALQKAMAKRVRWLSAAEMIVSHAVSNCEFLFLNLCVLVSHTVEADGWTKTMLCLAALVTLIWGSYAAYGW